MFTVAIRIILLPLTISGDRTEAERYKLSGEVDELKKRFSADPVARDAHVKNLLRSNRKIVFLSGLNLVIQTIVALMLWRIFAKGLLGADFHFLYDFVPQPKETLNLTFMGQYDLTKPNPTLNVLQSILIFIFEIEASLFSLFPITRKEIILAQLTLPIGSYIIFSQLPAGKKLFIITTLIFSIGYTTFSQIKYWWYRLEKTMNRKPASPAGGQEA